MRIDVESLRQINEKKKRTIDFFFDLLIRDCLEELEIVLSCYLEFLTNSRHYLRKKD